MGELAISGRMTAKTLNKQFLDEFGASFRICQGKIFANENATLAPNKKNKQKNWQM